MTTATVEDSSAEGYSGSQRRFINSLALRFLILFVVFLVVPVLIYQQFNAADRERQTLLLRNAQQQGELISQALLSRLTSATSGVPGGLTSDLERLVGDDFRIKLLLRPENIQIDDGFFYIAFAPSVPRSLLDREREQLISEGILGRLSQTCSGNLPLALRIRSEEGDQELLTSITSVNTDLGCWAVVTSNLTDEIIGSAQDQPYWQSPEVRTAGIIYLVMALLVLAIFFGILRNLRRFEELARQIRFSPSGTGSFATNNALPELHSVAEEFDQLVDSLRSSADSIRRASEDNAHAFKTPIGVIRQSVEPLKRMIGQDPRGARSIDMIEKSVYKLDNLVSLAQRLDEASADLVSAERGEVSISEFIPNIVRGYAHLESEGVVRIKLAPLENIRVSINADQFETVLENVIENAISFSPPGGTIAISARRKLERVEILVEDQGPGVDPADLERMFERYYSNRPDLADGHGETESHDGGGEPHFGIGLWIVRQNVRSVGGRVFAENRERGGLRMCLSLPIHKRR
ncbi:MAG: HAMP domain-containing sensor histidine kinase [Pseudomonadota bacterium]